jgi:2'-5' RNA ligase
MEPRLFIALPLPEPHRTTLNQWCKIQQTKWNFKKWVYVEDYHLTLQFLGNCSSEQIEEICNKLQEIAKRQVPFSLSLSRFGIFGRSEQPRILWVGVDGELEPLHKLQKSVVQAMQPLGFQPENRPFRPHITLARKCQMSNFPFTNLEEIPPIETHSWSVNELILYETKFGQEPMYSPVARFSFGK